MVCILGFEPSLESSILSQGARINALVDKLAKSAALEAVIWEFDSPRGHQ